MNEIGNNFSDPRISPYSGEVSPKAGETKGTKTAQSIINNGVGIESVATIAKNYLKAFEVSSLADSGGEPKLPKLSSSELERCMGAAEELTDLLRGDASVDVKLTSLGDLMAVVTCLLLASAQERKKMEQETRLAQITANMNACVASFEIGVQQAGKELAAGIKGGVITMLSGAVSVLSGALNIIGSIAGAKGGGKGAAAVGGTADAAENATSGIGQVISNVCNALNTALGPLSKLLQGGLEIWQSFDKHEAQMLGNVKETVNHFMQALSENANGLKGDIDDLKKYMESTIQMLKNMLESFNDTNKRVGGNI